MGTRLTAELLRALRQRSMFWSSDSCSLSHDDIMGPYHGLRFRAYRGRVIGLNRRIKTSGLLTKCEVKMADFDQPRSQDLYPGLHQGKGPGNEVGFWPSSFFRVYGPRRS